MQLFCLIGLEKLSKQNYFIEAKSRTFQLKNFIKNATINKEH